MHTTMAQGRASKNSEQEVVQHISKPTKTLIRATVWDEV